VFPTYSTSRLITRSGGADEVYKLTTDDKAPDHRFVPANEADPGRFACARTDCPVLRVRPQDTLGSFIHCLKCNRRVFPLVKN
jgi:hypothetical protein